MKTLDRICSVIVAILLAGFVAGALLLVLTFVDDWMHK